ncbi:tRNA pseudouridine(38-40) synthase TruA [Marinibactrum halimedae]|uniref:tRNA pseudouridine synthase A n=1 Tax=Marinibactrum halimedae TaxID=1444977 RepID=A0AA37T873_9GAMM|nr:tRNA pseudouridine(38-40) synthase TruA [Marinibactrum halimedae]MCD9460755.1 tRNA pseudouridine(38-40) synthase TruA [Marinibactrum halimedae]GLS26672.1 tRNA pseudouridine synthase A [Marinibactrum halimedae]
MHSQDLSNTDSPRGPRPYARNGEITADTPWPEGMHRVALGVEYNGTAFRGFQVQSHDSLTVQGYLHEALSQVAAEPITLVCAGRTDSGVHATGQVVHFDTLASRPPKAWFMGANTKLPDGIAIRWAQAVMPQFHARFSAQSRTYRYLIHNVPTRPALMAKQVTWDKRKLNIDAMRQAASVLVGEHDFSAFRASQCQAKHPVRRIDYLHIGVRGDFIIVEIRANAFLHHMVRNIVGVLLAIAAGEADVGWAEQVLSSRDRTQGGVTAHPYGLYLVDVVYDECFGLPKCRPGPTLLSEPLGAFDHSASMDACIGGQTVR